MRKLLAKLFESGWEPEGKLAAMRKLALAPEPLCPLPKLTQPMEKPLERPERIAKL